MCFLNCGGDSIRLTGRCPKSAVGGYMIESVGAAGVAASMLGVNGAGDLVPWAESRTESCKIDGSGR